ncbi:MAG: hypothetical protein GF329_07540 [Candidatus Lokiarchaeota archaeon]|nr:hypothetical protein [Candidatus Lokiarchaeota archaeon]
MNKSDIKREMNYERVFLRGPSYLVSMLARIKGEITRKQIEKSVLKVQKRHPLLNVKIEFDSDQNAWFKSRKTQDSIIKTIIRSGSSQWIESIKEENKNPFKFNRGPLIRFILLTSSKISDLIIYSHHSICDGLSLIHLIKDILIYIVNTDLKVEKIAPGPLLTKDIIKRGDYGNLFFKLIVKIVNRVWKGKDISFTEDDFTKLHQKYWDEDNISIDFWNLKQNKTKKLIEKCQDEGVTVNSALCTAFFASQNKVQDNKKKYLKTIALPVNIRDRLNVEVGDNFGCYTDGSFIKLNYNEKKDFWENVHLIHSKIRKELDNFKIKLVKFTKLHPTLIDALNFFQQGECDEKIVGSVSKASRWNKLNAGFSISNLGRLQIPSNYASLHLDKIYGPITQDPRIEKFIGINTLNDNIFFTLTYREVIIKKHIIKDFIDHAMKYLENSLEL